MVSPIPHFGLDIQVAWVSGFDSAFALAPSAQGYLFERGSTPYIGTGFQYVNATLDGVTASGVGFFANVGYEWKWKSGLGILLGGGVQYLQEITARSGSTMVTVGGQTAPNLEFSVRYRSLLPQS